MKLIDCNMLTVYGARTYGGATGSKIAVEYSDAIWMLKSQQRLRGKPFKNTEISYANDPISEYIGSHIYALFGVPVHETLLGTYNDKLCVLCKDLVFPGKITEFKEIRNTLMSESISQPTSGMSTKIVDILEVINTFKYFDNRLCLARFWTMFAVDSLIGNTDRNNGNWGFTESNGFYVLLPVYDCGGCLNNKRSDEQLQSDMQSGKIKTMALEYAFNYKGSKDKRVNPFHYMRDNMNEYLQLAVNMVSRLPIEKVNGLVDSVKPIISDVRAEYYKQIMAIRLEEIKKYRK